MRWSIFLLTFRASSARHARRFAPRSSKSSRLLILGRPKAPHLPTRKRYTMNFKWAAILAAVCIPPVAAASAPECAQSPARVIKVCISVQDGRATFEVSRLSRPVLAQSNLGLEFRGEHEPHYSAIKSVNRSSSDTSWEQPWGEERMIRDRHTEMVVKLKGDTPFTQSVEVTFRVFDEGLGFRYRYENIPAGREVAVSADRTSFHTLGDYVAWWHQALGQERDEYLYTHTDPGRRTLAESAGALADRRMELNLNEPNKLGSVSWFKPGKFVGVWWEMHVNKSTWESGPKHGANTRNVERYMDFAAKYGFDGVLAEGWNLGWDGDWTANGDKFSFTKSVPDFDMDAVVAYGKRLGVQLIGHNETAGAVPNYEAQLGDALRMYEKHGVTIDKTGYVRHSGDIIDEKGEREWFAGQYMVRHNLHVAEVAAAHHIAIDAPQPGKDT